MIASFRNTQRQLKTKPFLFRVSFAPTYTPTVIIHNFHFSLKYITPIHLQINTITRLSTITRLLISPGPLYITGSSRLIYNLAAKCIQYATEFRTSDLLARKSISPLGRLISDRPARYIPPSERLDITRGLSIRVRSRLKIIIIIIKRSCSQVKTKPWGTAYIISVRDDNTYIARLSDDLYIRPRSSRGQPRVEIIRYILTRDD